MTQTPAPTQPDDSNYRSIEDIIFDRQEKHVPGLESALIIAYGEHISSIQDRVNQGDGLIEKLYSAADFYIRNKHMSGKMPEDPDQKRIVESAIHKMIGFDPADERYKGKKTIDFQEVASLIGKSKKGYGEYFGEQFEDAVKLIPESEFGSFRSYVLKEAKELGLDDITEDSLPRMSWLKTVYLNRILPALARRRESKKADEERKEALEKARRSSP